ncbi:hypothetical protein FGK63_16385 [Ruegeria sediminis]|uniref:Uncharacterized protein n=1 Tax=Ruegeria sediminis TaxID=2583820 RepID=A0ABY2WV99_9RHOB|nr:hypothetical protein [Ruegeria sediminis]TMV05620.1 hypothetical protein FGK63_16385 [Ruegeria sediminis]
MLELLGTIGGNILSLPGILGLALGMMTRNFALAGALGGLVGVLETLLFAKFNFGNIEMLELTVAILVGIAAGTLGCAIRIKGTTV